MNEHYNQEIARHYSAYRPPLHPMILSYVLSKRHIFLIGLDVGCGTGDSAIALAKYCEHVYGIEPSAAMLKEVMPHEKITYKQGYGDNLPIFGKSIDVVTFAGSLFYAKSELQINELKRVCKPGSVVIPYDFKVRLDDVLHDCGISPQNTKSSYDHTVNFSDCADFTDRVVNHKQIKLLVAATELAHILLSSSNWYKEFADKYGVSNPFALLANDLERKREQYDLYVIIYYSKHQITIE